MLNDVKRINTTQLTEVSPRFKVMAQNAHLKAEGSLPCGVTSGGALVPTDDGGAVKASLAMRAG